jgi:hypothetical protein
MSILDAVTEMTGEPKPKGKLGKLARAARVKPVPVHSDPFAELRRLVQQHKNETKIAVSLVLRQTDRKDRETGEVTPSNLPDDLKADLRAVAKNFNTHRKSLESAMTRELRKVPVYDVFLDHVFGCGPVVAAYLVAMIRIDRASKVSNLRRYCGYACDVNGKLERRDGSPKYAPDGTIASYGKDNTPGTGTFNADLRHGALAAGMPKGAAHKKGMHKAADLFIEDLYVVWRALAGLDVWPSYYTAKISQREHGGGVPKVIGFRRLSMEEALSEVGHVGGLPLAAPAVDADEEVGECEDD